MQNLLSIKNDAKIFSHMKKIKGDNSVISISGLNFFFSNNKKSKQWTWNVGETKNGQQINYIDMY